MAKRKQKQKRSAKRTPNRFEDYVLVIEDNAGRQLALAVQTDQSRAPIAGEEVPLREKAAKEMPHMAGTYLVHRVAHLPPPGGTVTIDNYTLPWCYARRAGSGIPASGPMESAASAGPEPPGAARLEPLGGEMDQTTAAEVARKSRDLATDLDDMADDVAVAFHSGASGQLDLKFVERLNDASRRAKQVSFAALLRSKFPRKF